MCKTFALERASFGIKKWEKDSNNKVKQLTKLGSVTKLLQSLTNYTVY